MTMQHQKIGVVGAGAMGSGIAQKIAMEGFPVILCDRDQIPLDRGMERIAATLEEGVARKALTAEQKTQTLQRLSATTDLSRLAECQLVIEAVFEDLAVKQELFATLDRHCPPSTILATNTSSFLVRDLTSGLAHPERVIGLHFFYHPAKNRLVEVIAGPLSDPSLVKRAWELMAATGKTPIATLDAPGFCVNRFFVPWLNEAVRLLDEGAASLAAIEAAAKTAFGIGMGPFELMNLTGIPIAYHAAKSLAGSLGDFYLPAAGLIAQYELGQLWDLSGPVSGLESGEIAERLLAVTWAIAAQVVADGIATLEDVDRGAKIGLRWRKGPFELMNAHGMPRAIEVTERVLAKIPTLTAPPLLTQQGAKPWEFRLVDTILDGAIAQLVINRPEALNALNGEVIAQLEAAFDEVLANPDVQGIVLRGAGKAFVAGADIRFFVKAIEADHLGSITEFTRRGQALFLKIASSPKPVTAALHGLALGGGAELALTAHRVVATTKAAIGFPETGIGIYPALGGTFRTTRRMGDGLAKYALLSGRIFSAQEAFDMGMVDELVDPLALEETLRRVALQPVVASFGAKRDFSRIEGLFAGNPPQVLVHEISADPEAQKIQRAVRGKAPIAVQVSVELIERNQGLPDESCYANELAQLEAIFSTSDALVGLKSVGRDRPIFQGR